MIEALTNVTAMSLSDICKESGLAIGQVRHALRKLKKAEYFSVTQPSRAELNAGGWTLKYKARLELRGFSNLQWL